MGDNVATVKCDVSAITWHMTCIGAIWTGDVQTCDSGKIIYTYACTMGWAAIKCRKIVRNCGNIFEMTIKLFLSKL